MKAKLAYTGIRVKNMDESIQFYTKVLGMKLTGRSRIEATQGEVAGLVSEDNGPTIELNCYEPESKYYDEYNNGEELDHIGFVVQDLDLALKEAADAGYPTILTVDTGKSRWAYLQDPNGIYIELCAE